jgi:hypothetical protein
LELGWENKIKIPMGRFGRAGCKNIVTRSRREDNSISVQNRRGRVKIEEDGDVGLG